MRFGFARALLVALAALSLAACGATGGLSSNGLGAQASATADGGQGSVQPGTPDGLLGSDPNDDLSLGKRHFRAGDFGLAEQHFRKAAELHPRDGEAWLGLAASYDRLRRFDLADRAYAQAIRIAGPTVEILNNQGYSYMLRGDYRTARAKLNEAQRKAPGNPYVQNNMRLLAESARSGKSIQ
ncbi:MAG: tetratricopeptide repeat protein [Xanthobacteraceae bacterium]|jgi:Tfp pilus assembly protein PilF|uniref:tetratricopeptide repeat protein n=1 Tax=Pseudolabrys sp. TaxID=1960880 RepID=UPI003D0D80B6